ncbi:histidinol-phosphate phosphatase family protein [Solidesulfovibrio carbinoliphilus subsp. oakridgensis]|uniref:D,D-heptose 1,7-bisphosphate phosphatase n=1 Tax=Solidesulfovibrio carbinoliphilus subsp. oakridgensis TaxID=694327 RepID=G7QBQ9_9BACT|nr:HAD-IIIA family hydrolase [Solidesulfovibrio carbinoliphilus]EHJ49402.1 histidinol-phosphate phosphatase family protein [Solidesulfovibrio carbinoliphilus subsp. oakridgensis]
MAPTIRNVLLDRDGTIIEDRHYLSNPDGVVLVPGAGEALGRLTRAGARLFCVTNQSGLGRGYFKQSDFEAVQARLLALLEPHGAVLADTAFCPHGPDDGCPCRKPAIGLFAALAGRYGLVPAETAVIGDKASDIHFGLALGSPLTILVATGHGTEQAAACGLPGLEAPLLVLADRRPGWPHVLARDLPAAAAYLLDEGFLPAALP